MLTHSVGLGDAIHNLSDVSTSFVVFAGFFISKRPASERYPYGLERAEDIAGLGAAAIIWASAAFAASRRIHSATLLADAKHSWLDAISSAGALAGLVAVALGFPLGDPIAGFAITAFIAHVGWEVTHDVVHPLMDGWRSTTSTRRDGRRKMPAVFRFHLCAGDGWNEAFDSNSRRTTRQG